MYHTRNVLIGGICVPQGFGVCWAALNGENLLIDTDRLALLNEASFSTHLSLLMAEAINRPFDAIELVLCRFTVYRDQPRCR